MKRRTKTVLSLIIVFAVLFGCVSLSVNGANGDVIIGTLKNGMISDYVYSDSFFSKDPYEYSIDTALISMHFAMAVMHNDNGAGKDIELADLPDCGIEFLNDLGFSSVKTYGYDEEFTIDGIGCMIGSKNIVGKDVTVIALGIRGGNYEWEWGGNFKIGTGEQHEGFSIAKDEVAAYLRDYINDNKSSFCSDVKIWITGFSRSAAVGDLLAAGLDNGSCSVGYTFDPSDVYAYLFEVPGCSRSTETKNALYSNIFNIINPIDVVPRFMPEVWGYSRYGTEVFLPSLENDENYGSLRSLMEKEYNQITGLNYYEDFTFYRFNSFQNVMRGLTSGKVDFISADSSIGQSRFIDNMVEILATELIKSPENYVENYQSFLVKLVPSIIVDRSNFSFTGSVEDILSVAVKFVQKNIAYLFLSPMKFYDALRQTLALYLEENMKVNNIYFPEGLTYDDFYKISGELDDLLFSALRHPDCYFTTYKYIANRSPAGDFICFIPHYQELELAWLRALAKAEE